MRSPSALIALVVVVAVVALGIGLDLLSPSQATSEPEPTTAGPATSGGGYCAVGDTAAGRALDIVTTATDGRGDTPAGVTVGAFSEGNTALGGVEQVFPGTSAVRRVDLAGDAVGVAARWFDTPVAVHRIWHVGDDEDLADGFVSGPCPTAPSTRWIVPGVGTAGGAQARLAVANPFGSDASVAVRLMTPDGPLSPERLENVVVPARSVREVALNDFAPEQPDLGAIVETRSGRVVVEGLQTTDAAIGGIDGISLVSAAAATAESWTVPWVGAGGGRASWLWVTNPGEDPAAVEVTMHGPDGGVVPEGLGEVTLPPGTVTRIDLTDLGPEGVRGPAVSLRSQNGVPVAVSAATQATASDPRRTGLTVQLAATDPADRWLLAAEGTAGRNSRVSLANPTPTDAVVDVSVWNGSTIVTPEELQDVAVPAGAAVQVEVGSLVGETGQHSIIVATEAGQVVAGRQGADTAGTLRLVASVGVPSTRWAGGQTVPPVDHDPRMLQRIGTSMGVPSTAPTAPEDEPSPLPSPLVPPPVSDEPTPSPAPSPPGTPSPST